MSQKQERTLRQDVLRYLGIPPYSMDDEHYRNHYFSSSCTMKYGAVEWDAEVERIRSVLGMKE